MKRIAHDAGLLLEGAAMHVHLQRGWSDGQSLAEALADDRACDYATGYTHAGIQRADLEVYPGPVAAQRISFARPAEAGGD